MGASPLDPESSASTSSATPTFALCDMDLPEALFLQRVDFISNFFLWQEGFKN